MASRPAPASLARGPQIALPRVSFREPCAPLCRSSPVVVPSSLPNDRRPSPALPLQRRAHGSADGAERGESAPQRRAQHQTEMPTNRADCKEWRGDRAPLEMRLFFPSQICRSALAADESRATNQRRDLSWKGAKSGRRN